MAPADAMLTADDDDSGEGWQAVFRGSADAFCLNSKSNIRTTCPSGLVLPGSFNPLHVGHRRLAAIAASLLGGSVEFELSITNVDKAPLGQREVARRASQFGRAEPLWLTRAPTFVEKAVLFPASTFIVGADTILRVADPRYYQKRAIGRDDAISAIADARCRFLVFGRLVDGGFRTLSTLDLPPALAYLCEEIEGDTFRMDLSSTDLRNANEPSIRIKVAGTVLCAVRPDDGLRHRGLCLLLYVWPGRHDPNC